MAQNERKKKNKRFSDAKSRKNLINLSKKNKRKIKNLNKKKAIYIKDNAKNQHNINLQNISNTPVQHNLIVPTIFNIFKDAEITLNFFDRMLETIDKCFFNDLIYLDFSGVRDITPDAIMYLIAIMHNGGFKGKSFRCAGNLPNEFKAKKVIEQSGFYEYVSSIYHKETEFNDKVARILSGKYVNGEFAQKFCDFVQNSCDKKNIDTKKLYRMILELMTNTYQHAYNPTEQKYEGGELWYIFAQDVGSSIHFVFLDTGIGIPKTVYKKFYEQIQNLFIKNDAIYIKSALEGAFRTETREDYRGKGLPEIYKDACDLAIEKLSVISGQGKCTVNKNKYIEATKLKHNFEGTLFTWDIPKIRKEKVL